MAISDKLNYLIETKQLFKDRLNSLGAEIIESTTFRNYLNWLDEFYNQSSDKTDLSINGVVGRTSQDSTTGKNLFDYTTSSFFPSNVNITTENNTITMTTAITVNSINLFFRAKIPDEYLINGETYTISSDNISGVAQSLKLQLRNKNGSNANKPQLNSVVYDNTYSLFIVGNIYSTNSQEIIQEGTTAIIKNVQVEKGTNTTPYEPYTGGKPSPSPDYSQPINNLNGDVSYKVRGKNVFDESLITNTGGAIKYIPINVKKNTDYTLSTNSGTSTLANVFLSTTNSGVTTNNNGAMIGQPRTINSGDNNIMYVGYRNDLSSYWIQLEEGSSATSYEPYISESFLLSLGDIELCAISDYKDRIYSQNGEFYLEKKTGKVVLDETMTYYKSATTSIDKYYTRLGYTFDSSIPRSAISNCFIYKPNGVAVGQFDYSQNNQWLALFFCYAEYNTSTIDDFKNYVKNNETYCIITLPTPTTTKITQENYPTLYSQLLAIQGFLTKYKINKEFLLDYSSPEIKY